jgi:hypothetical protein
VYFDLDSCDNEVNFLAYAIFELSRFIHRQKSLEDFDQLNVGVVGQNLVRDKQFMLVLVVIWCDMDCLCGILVRVPGYRSRGPSSILGTTRLSVK